MQIRPIVYESLTPRQRVIATIEAEARDDKDEVQRLVKSCPKKTYRENDAEYTDMMRDLVHVAMAIECVVRDKALAALIAIYEYDVEPTKLLQTIADIQRAWQLILESMGISSESMTKTMHLHSNNFVNLWIQNLLPNPDPENVDTLASTMKEYFE